MTKSFRKKMLRENLAFCGSYFQFLHQSWVYRTDMEGNAAVTLQFEDLAVKLLVFKRRVHLFSF